MPKFKPHKGLLKRVKVTGTGRIKRPKAGMGHLMSGKPGKQRRRLRREVLVTGRPEFRNLRAMGQR